MMLRSALAAVVLTSLSALPAVAETVHVKIAPEASYDQSLICFQFHGVSSQILKAASESAEVPAEEKERLATMGSFAGFVQAHWRAHIDTVKGDRTREQINADLQSKTAQVIADAQAGLNGDTAARGRQREVEKACLGFEDRKITPDAE